MRSTSCFEFFTDFPSELRTRYVDPFWRIVRSMTISWPYSSNLKASRPVLESVIVILAKLIFTGSETRTKRQTKRSDDEVC